MHPEKSKTLSGGVRARIEGAGERIGKIDEKVLQNPARILRSIPSSRSPYRGNENLRSGQRTKEGTRLGRASLIKAQKYIFELGETADRGRERERERGSYLNEHYD